MFNQSPCNYDIIKNILGIQGLNIVYNIIIFRHVEKIPKNQITKNSEDIESSRIFHWLKIEN